MSIIESVAPWEVNFLHRHLRACFRLVQCHEILPNFFFYKVTEYHSERIIVSISFNPRIFPWWWWWLCMFARNCRKYVHARDDDRIVAWMFACSWERSFVRMNEHVSVQDDDDVQVSWWCLHDHARGRMMIKVTSNAMVFFHYKFHMHIEVCSPKYYFSRYGLHEDDNRRAKSSCGLLQDAYGRLLKSSRRAFKVYHRSAQKNILNIMCSCESSSNVVNHACWIGCAKTGWSMHHDSNAACTRSQHAE